MPAVFEQLNVDLFLYINQLATSHSYINTLIIVVAEYMPYLFILVLLDLWFLDNNYKLAALQSGLSVMLALLFSYVISLFYFHPRPFMSGLGINLVEHTPDSSFPSDHSTLMFAVAWVLYMAKFTRKWSYGLLALALVSGICRVIVGVHFPLDIFMAAVVAGLASIIVIKSTLLNQFLAKRALPWQDNKDSKMSE